MTSKRTDMGCSLKHNIVSNRVHFTDNIQPLFPLITSLQTRLLSFGTTKIAVLKRRYHRVAVPRQHSACVRGGCVCVVKWTINSNHAQTECMCMEWLRVAQIPPPLCKSYQKVPNQYFFLFFFSVNIVRK